MYTLFRSLQVSELLSQQLPALGAAFLVAELFYKWGSFALECAGFLATWFLFDMVISIFRSVIAAKRRPRPDPL